jgi:hypothetical protein
VTNIDYERNKKYFRLVSYKPGVILIVIGALTLFSRSFGLIIVGLLVAGGGAFLIYRQVAGRPADREIDRQVSGIHTELRQRALTKLGLDAVEVELIDPVVVSGYCYNSLGTPWQAKKGKDGKFRSSNYEGVAIFFAEQELHSYKYQMSLITPNEARVQTDVYFYRDVVSVATDLISIPLKAIGEQKQQVVQLEIFKLTTSGGTTVQCSMDTAGDPTGRAIQGARQLVRDKKMHAL